MTSNKPTRPAIAGNKLVLVGAVLYLLEWVAIIGGGVDAPLGPGASGADLSSAYGGHAEAWGWAAGWFSVAEPGRLLIMVGLAVALTESGRRSRLMAAAVSAMAISVTVEIVVYAVVAAAAQGASGVPVGTLRLLDLVASELNLMIYAPMGISMLCAGLAMWRSGLFVQALPVLALVSGVAFVAIGAALGGPGRRDLVDPLSSAALLFWVWMLWTGILLWRRSTAAEEPVGTSGSADPVSIR
jgi:hypothetical protein